MAYTITFFLSAESPNPPTPSNTVLDSFSLKSYNFKLGAPSLPAPELGPFTYKSFPSKAARFPKFPGSISNISIRFSKPSISKFMDSSDFSSSFLSSSFPSSFGLNSSFFKAIKEGIDLFKVPTATPVEFG